MVRLSFRSPGGGGRVVLMVDDRRSRFDDRCSAFAERRSAVDDLDLAYRADTFDKYSTVPTPTKQAFVCHRNAPAADFARIIFASTVHRPASTRVAAPRTVPAPPSVDPDPPGSRVDPTSTRFRSPSSQPDVPATSDAHLQGRRAGLIGDRDPASA